MELRKLATIILRWWWVLVLGTALSAGAVYYVSRLQPKVYRASALLLINQSQSFQAFDYSSLMLSERLARTYAELIRKPPVLAAVAERLGLTVSTARLATLVQVRIVRDTQLLELLAEHENPALAREIANTTAEVFIAQRVADQLGRNASSREALQEQIAAIKAEIVRTSQALDRAKEAAQAVQSVERSRAASAGESAEVTRLQGLLVQQQATYSQLLKSESDLVLLESQVLGSIKVVVPAEMPQSPVRPNVLQNTGLGAVTGLLLVLGAIFLVEYLDDTLKSEEDVRAASGLATLAVIFRMSGRTRVETPRLLGEGQTHSGLGEAYRILRANVDFAWAGTPGQVVMVTSPGPREGKSTTAANLALMLAEDGRRVVLVDADLRRPSLHRVFEVSNERGLSNVLAGPQVRVTECLQPTGVERLLVVPSGPLPPNPAELVGSPRFAEALAELRQAADVVLLDTPPVLGIVDPAVIVGRVDGVVLVVEANRTRQEALRRAVEALARSPTRRLGVVLNKVGERSARYYYYYRYYHGYYHRDASGSRASSNGKVGETKTAARS